MNDKKKYPSVSSDVIARDVDSASVLLNLENGRYYSLNSTGGFAFSLFDGKTSLQQLAERMADEFGVDVSEARQDLEELITELHTEGLVELHDKPL